MRKNQQRRSDCPINFSLETFGDTWSLLIIRDIVYFGKKTHGEFLGSDERIATNISGGRLAHLEQKGIVIRKPHPADNRKEEIVLTEKGLDLIPLLLAMASWGALHDDHTGAPRSWIDIVHGSREKVIKLIRTTVRAGGSIFAGPGSVVSTLGLR
jgi:DNA-binding HxlR family transcriptional regulator